MQIQELDWKNEAHCRAFEKLLGAYMKDPMGEGPAMTAELSQKIISGLRSNPYAFSLLAIFEKEYAGLANCFITFSTFQAKPVINIHDLVVAPEFRNKGIGRLLLQAVAARGEKLDACKITLEVRNDNLRAQHLYHSEGFEEGNPPMLFWSKYLQ
jgi:ribosomal protein S18 acetylase RimI-like enzyme